MKKYIISGLIILNSILTHFCFAQVKDKLIKLSPEIMDTIDFIERNYYNLFPEVKDFQYAVIYLSSDSTTVIKIICKNDKGLSRDTVITNNADYVGNIKTYIRQINLDRLENYETEDIITVTKLDGNQVVGKLLAVQDSSFIIVPDTISDVGTLTFLRAYTKLNVKEVQSVFIDFDVLPSVNTGAFIGAIPGCISGVIIGVNSVHGGFFDMSESDVKVWAGFFGGLIGLVVGAGLGAGIGYLISPAADETIEINSASDLEKLKEYVVQ